MKKTISLVIACAILLFGSNFAFAQSGGKQTTILGISSIESVQLPNVDNIASFDANKEYRDLKDLSADDLLLLIAQTSYYIEQMSGDIEQLEMFVPVTYSSLVPKLTENNYLQIITNKNYPVPMRRYFLDFYNSHNKSNLEMFITALTSIASDMSEPDGLRSYAAVAISANSSDGSSVIESLYYDVEEEYKPMLLKSLMITSSDKAKAISEDVMQDYPNHDVPLVALANHVLAKTAKSGEDMEAFFSINRKLLQDESVELAEHSIYALAEIKSKEAVDLVFEVADFNNFGVKGFVEKNLGLVMEYLETASVAQVQKCIMAVPLTEFIPVIKSIELSEQESKTTGIDMTSMYDAIDDYNQPDNDMLRDVASGFQGYAAYRDGVGDVYPITAGAWHGAIVNSIDATGAEAFIQATGYGVKVKKVSEAEFLDGNSFRGFRKYVGMSQRERNNVLTTARELSGYGVAYIFNHLMRAVTYGLGDLDIITPDRISYMRCDGVVEYCFEYNGMKLQGTSAEERSWDICTPRGCNRGHNALIITPYTQYLSDYFTW